MAGVKGMKQKTRPQFGAAEDVDDEPNSGASIRDLLITVPGAKADNARKLRNLQEKEDTSPPSRYYPGGRQL
jgi:hypothetical protein